MQRASPSSGAQQAGRVAPAIFLIAAAAAAEQQDRVVSLVLVAAMLVVIAVLLWTSRGYDWRGRPTAGVGSGGGSAALFGLGTVILVGLIGAVAVVGLDSLSASESPSTGEAFAYPSFELGVIPRSLNAGAPTGGSTPVTFASYVDRLCAAAAPYQQRLVLDVGILGRGSLDVPRPVLLARVKTAYIFDGLSVVVGEEAQLLAVERPSRRAVAPASEGGRAGRLRAAFTRLVGLEETLSSRYHQIALRWFDHQIPIAAAPVRSIAAGSAAAAGPAAEVVLRQRQVGASGCGAVERPTG